MKRHQRTVTNLDAIKAMKRGEREAEQQRLGPGFHSFSRTHRSKKTYTRKQKHKSSYS
jgi:hypothetical protein